MKDRYRKGLLSVADSRAAHGIYTTYGNGTKDFAQNHLEDPARKIVYTALEGDEAGIYTRVNARLKDGVARIPLGDTFKWVTNPDIGLTAQVTPRDDCNGLRVVSLTTEELVVEELAGGRSQASFEGGRNGEIDLSRSQALVAAIGTFDPASESNPVIQDFEDSDLQDETNDAGDAGTRPGSGPNSNRHVGSHGGLKGDAEAIGQRVDPALPSGAVLLRVDGAVEPGDLLSLDPEREGVLRVADTMADPFVVGVAILPSSPSPSSDSGIAEVAVMGSGFATVRVDAGYGAIRAGDLLAASATPGHAMVTTSSERGTVIGKALESLEVGQGTIRVLLIPR